MGKRRTTAEIVEVMDLYDATSDVARRISDTVNPADPTPETEWVSVRAGNPGGVKAAYQRDRATDLVVSFTTKDPDLAERVAKAIRRVLKSIPTPEQTANDKAFVASIKAEAARRRSGERLYEAYDMLSNAITHLRISCYHRGSIDANTDAALNLLYERVEQAVHHAQR